MENSKQKASMTLALTMSALAAFIGGSLWALIVSFTRYQISYLAIGIGFFVGFTLRFVGGRCNKRYGIIAAILALLGCAFGDFLATTYLVALESKIEFIEFLMSLIRKNLITDLIKATFQLSDVLFYGISAYAAYKTAIVDIEIDEDEDEEK